MHDEGHLSDPERMQPEEEDRVESGQDPTDPDYPSEPGGQEAPSSASIAAHLDERGGDRADGVENVPAGGAGADAGAGSAARVDGSTEPSEPGYESAHSDEPGVGAKRPD